MTLGIVERDMLKFFLVIDRLFNQFRHCAISILANDSAFTMKQVQGYARHANYNTTVDIYSHTDDSVMRVDDKAYRYGIRAN